MNDEQIARYLAMPDDDLLNAYQNIVDEADHARRIADYGKYKDQREVYLQLRHEILCRMQGQRRST